jgi:hypothetical protein
MRLLDMAFIYLTGEEVRAGDVITYHGERGSVLFVVNGKTGDEAIDWYLDKYPGGGIMIDAKEFGNVFITDSRNDEDLVLIARKS